MKAVARGLRFIVLGIHALVRWIGWVAYFIAPLLLRAALAIPFLRSGFTKWSGFLSLSPVTPYMFEQMFKIHLFGHTYGYPAPDVLAYIDAIAEIVLPCLIIVGFATRFSAFGLLVVIGFIQLTVPSAWSTFHLPWAALAVALMALGAGPLSLDRIIAWWFERREGHRHPGDAVAD